MLRYQVPRSQKEDERLLAWVSAGGEGDRKQRWDGESGLALEKDATVEDAFTLSEAAVFRWGEHVPWIAERYGLEYVETRLPESNSFEFDLGKIKELQGREPQHDVRNVAEAMFRGEETGVRRGGEGDAPTLRMVNPE